MLKLLKKIFYTEVPKVDMDTEYNKNQPLINRVDSLLTEYGLKELVKNEVVSIYLMELWHDDVRTLLNPEGNIYRSVKFTISVRDYFDGREDNIYYLLKRFKEMLEVDDVSKKQVSDIETIVEMFEFYISD